MISTLEVVWHYLFRSFQIKGTIHPELRLPNSNLCSMLSKQPLYFAFIQTRLRKWPAAARSRPAGSEDAGAFALRISTSGCGARNAGATVRERSETAGVLSAAKFGRGQASIECVKRGSIGDACSCGSDRDFGREGVCRLVSRFLLGHGFGALPAPCCSSLFCFGCTARAGYGFRSKSVCEVQRKISSEPP